MSTINIQLYNNSNPEMSNIFKTNSRFAGLIDNHEYNKDAKLIKKMGWKEGDVLGKNQDGIKTPHEVEKCQNNLGIGFNKDEKKINSFNSFKDNGFKDNGFREPRQNRRYPSDIECQRLIQEQKAEDLARKEIEKQEALKIENFPEFVINKKEIDVNQGQSYLEILKQVEVQDDDKNIDQDLVNLKPGWILIKKDKVTGKLITKCNIQIDDKPKIEENTEMNVLKALVELHESRTQEFIELNGYDTWERMFKCRDWRERETGFEDDSDDSDEDYDDYDDYFDDEDEEDY